MKDVWLTKMEPDELALSDVHVCGPSLTDSSTAYKDYQVAKTRFIYTLDPETSEQDPDSEVSSSGSPASQCSLELDEEGDVIVKRNTKADVEVITIEHTMATRLPDVGLQVWQGCLLLCDYILDNSATFKDKVVLELGGGTGLASIVMATVAKAVICTDIGQDVLTLCRKNIDAHKDRYANKTVIVRELNWNTWEIKTDAGEDVFTWNKADIELFQKVHVIIAADVIYDDNLTDDFFKSISKLMSKKPGMKTIVALEKRLNFTLSDLEISCPAYNHFKEHLAQLSSADEKSDVEFTVLQVTDIEQFFYYDRSKYLELWEITCQVKKKSSSS